MSDDSATPARKRAPRRRKPKPQEQAQAQAGPETHIAATTQPEQPHIAAPPVESKATKRPAAARKGARSLGPPADGGHGTNAGAAVMQSPHTAEETRTSPPSALPVASVPPVQRVLRRVPLPVRWRDLDAFNHVNNSKYLSYLEEARLQWMLTLPGQGLDERVAPVVAAAQLNYRRPIEWPSEVMVELFVERLGNTSVTVGHRILGERPGVGPILFCDGHVVMVWIDRSSGSAAPLPDAVRHACT